ncbi:MAG: VOC family protein [Chloroflexi bacterium]|nr:VOC family protein [Chloroflexota bacterium]
MGPDTLSPQWAGGVRDGYPAGVPCWIDATQPDARAAADFYCELLGWELENMLPTSAPGQYFVARLHGRDVAAISSIGPGDSERATWNTYIWVDDADAAGRRITQAGGRVLAEPFDVLGAGRMAVYEDPSGAASRIWQAREHRGAQLVNAPGSWNWSNLNAPDAERAMRFYSAVFGWEFSQVDMGAGAAWMVRVPGYADFLEVRNPGIRERHAAAGAPPGFTDAVGWLEPAATDAHARWSVTLAVADADSAAARTAALGGTVVSGPIDAPYSRVVQITDPQGAALTLSQFKMPE